MTGDIREQLRIDLINAFCASLPAEKREDVSIRLSVILSRYEIAERRTEVVAWMPLPELYEEEQDDDR